MNMRIASLVLLVLAALSTVPSGVHAGVCDAVALSTCPAAPPPGAGSSGPPFCIAMLQYLTCAQSAGCSDDVVVSLNRNRALTAGCTLPDMTEPIIFSNNGTMNLKAPQGDIMFETANQRAASVTGILADLSALVQLQGSHATGTGINLANLNSTLTALTNAQMSSLIMQLTATNSAATQLSSAVFNNNNNAISVSNSIATVALAAAGSAGVGAQSFAQSQVTSLQTNLQGQLAQVGSAAFANVTQLRADASNGVVNSINNLNSQVVQPINRTLTQGLASLDARSTNSDSNINATNTTLQRLLNCVAQGQALSNGQCVATPARDVTMLPTQPCTAARNGIITFNSTTNVVTLCSSSSVNPLVLVPANPGTRQNPALSCGDVAGAGLPDGMYYVGSPYRQVLCRGGQISFQPPFEVLGQPFSYFPYDADTQDVRGRVYSIRSGSSIISPVARVINSVLHNGTSTFSTVNIDQTVWANPFSVAMWVRFISLNRAPAAANDNGILGHFSTTATNGNAFHLGERSGGWYFGFYGSAANFDLAGPTNTLANNTWYHAVFTYDGNANKMIYQNGVLVAQQTNSPKYTGVAATTTIGRYPWDPSGVQAFQGSLDDLVIFNKVLTPAQIATLYQSYRNFLPDTIRSCANVLSAGFPDNFYSFQPALFASPNTVNCVGGVAQLSPPLFAQTPIDYFPFDNSLTDVMPQPAVLSLAGGVVAYGTGRAGTCLNFNNITVYNYAVPTQSIFQYAYTVSVWVRFNTVNRGLCSSASDNAILGSGLGLNQYGLHLGERCTAIWFGFYGVGNDVASAPGLLSQTNVWYHITWVYFGNGCRAIYLNGVAVSLFSNGSPNPTGCAGLFIASGGPTFLGQYAFGTGRLDGSLDMLQLFTYALSPSDVAMQFAQS